MTEHIHLECRALFNSRGVHAFCEGQLTRWAIFFWQRCFILKNSTLIFFFFKFCYAAKFFNTLNDRMSHGILLLDCLTNSQHYHSIIFCYTLNLSTTVLNSSGKIVIILFFNVNIDLMVNRRARLLKLACSSFFSY